MVPGREDEDEPLVKPMGTLGVGWKWFHALSTVVNAPRSGCSSDVASELGAPLPDVLVPDESVDPEKEGLSGYVCRPVELLAVSLIIQLERMNRKKEGNMNRECSGTW